MREISADHASVGGGVIGATYLRVQQKVHVKDGVGRQDDEVGGLLPFAAAGIDEGDAGGMLARTVEVDAHHFRIVAQRKIRFANQEWQDGRLRTGFGIIAATEPLAKSAIGAWAQMKPQRICIGLRHIAGRLGKRLVAEVARGLCKQCVAEGLFLRRVGVGPGARSLKRITAFLNLAA